MRNFKTLSSFSVSLFAVSLFAVSLFAVSLFAVSLFAVCWMYHSFVSLKVKMGNDAAK